MLLAAAVVVVAAEWTGVAGGGRMLESDGLPGNDPFNTKSSSTAGCRATAHGSPVKDCKATFMHHRTHPVLREELQLLPEGLEGPPPLLMRIGGEPRELTVMAAAAAAAAAAVVVLGAFFGAWRGAPELAVVFCVFAAPVVAAAAAAALAITPPLLPLLLQTLVGSLGTETGIVLTAVSFSYSPALPPFSVVADSGADEAAFGESPVLPQFDVGERWRYLWWWWSSSSCALGGGCGSRATTSANEDTVAALEEKTKESLSPPLVVGLLSLLFVNA